MITGGDRTRLVEMSGQVPHGLIVQRSGGVDSLTRNELIDLLFAEFEEVRQIVLSKEDGKKTVGVARVRELLRDLSVGSFGVRAVRVVVFEQASELGAESQNAILKVLEEPPEGVYFIFCSENEAELLATVRSRCQIFVLNEPSDDEMLDFAESCFEGKREDLNLVWMRSGRRTANFMRLMEDEGLRTEAKELIESGKTLVRGAGNETAKIISNVKNRDEAKSLVEAEALVLTTLLEKSLASCDLSSAQRFEAKLSVCEEALDYLAKNGNFKLALARLI